MLVTNKELLVNAQREAYHGVIILEVMDRYAGHIALHTGLAGGADVILIPEKSFDIEEVCEYIKCRRQRGRNFSLVVAEGAKPKGGKEIVHSGRIDEFDHTSLGGVSYYLAKEIERCAGIETRVVVLGHLQRGGFPTAFDRVLATRYGVAAIDLVHQGLFDHMIAVKGNMTVPAPFSKVIGQRKTVDPELYEIAKIFWLNNLPS